VCNDKTSDSEQNSYEKTKKTGGEKKQQNNAHIIQIVFSVISHTVPPPLSFAVRIADDDRRRGSVRRATFF